MSRYKTIPLKECPYCGSDSGYYYKYTSRHVQSNCFDHSPCNNESHVIIDSKATYCDHCDKRIEKFMKPTEITEEN